ncbi:D-aminoacyl-tRNA deacylase [Nostocoides veronense]|uniref:D-aminoacyl-tRNA deacylase n=1 Tax=Nostocoides veronense TaxID=330836 RepID=UPI0031DC9FDE
MRVVIQRADGASVVVAGERISGFVGPGLVVLAGVTHGDGPAEVAFLARKIAQLRILREERSAEELGAPVLLISQFTLYADTRKGRRPSWNGAAPGLVAEPLVAELGRALSAYGLPVHEGVFGADMAVSFTNDGPVTVLLDSAAP